MTQRVSPIDAEHRALGARMVPFAGYSMPVQYPAGLTIECGGEGAYSLLQWLLTNDLARISPGHAQYTHVLDPDDAHVVDDIIVWWVDDQRFFVMPNASNTERLLAAFDEAAAYAEGDVVFADVTRTRAVLAVQGPEARALLAKVRPDAAAVPRFEVKRLGPLVVAGTGYTGEDGVEIHVPADEATAEALRRLYRRPYRKPRIDENPRRA